jgi:hypothetical protein
MVKAYLAETYDGIGQVVKVEMSRGGVTQALNARVAAGDFGGGRTFPVGTPVVVISNHGKLEVLLGNIPSGHWEDFKQSTIGGIGESQAGLGDWVTDSFWDEETSNTDGGVTEFTGPGGSIPPAGTRHNQVYLDVTDTTQPWYSTKFYFEVKFKVNVIPIVKSWLELITTFLDISSGFSRVIDISVSDQASSDNYISLKNSSGNTSFFTPPDPYVVDTWYFVGVEIEAGVSLRLFFWDEGSSKPESPQLVRADTGSVFTDETNLILDLFNSARAGIVVTGGTLTLDYLDLIDLAA